MKSLRIIAVAASLAALSACGGSGGEEANADANIALETENLDAGLNAVDPLANADANLGGDLNGTDANATDANAVDANTTNAAQ